MPVTQLPCRSPANWAANSRTSWAAVPETQFWPVHSRPALELRFFEAAPLTFESGFERHIAKVSSKLCSSPVFNGLKTLGLPTTGDQNHAPPP